jgi:hypothetical protein
MEIRKFIKTTIREYLNENINNYIKWDSLSNSVKNDITENIYDNNKYVEKNYWNPVSLKDSINDLIPELQPKFKVEYKNTNKLYDELTQIGRVVSERNVERLTSILRNGDKLDPIILNDGKFFDGGHRLTAYKRMGIDKIPTIEIGFMLKFDYEKWENGEIDF